MKEFFLLSEIVSVSTFGLLCLGQCAQELGLPLQGRWPGGPHPPATQHVGVILQSLSSQLRLTRQINLEDTGNPSLGDHQVALLSRSLI